MKDGNKRDKERLIAKRENVLKEDKMNLCKL